MQLHSLILGLLVATTSALPAEIAQGDAMLDRREPRPNPQPQPASAQSPGNSQGTQTKTGTNPSQTGKKQNSKTGKGATANTASANSPSGTNQSTSGGRDPFELCQLAKNCEICTTNGKKDVCFKKGYEPGTAQGDALIKGTGGNNGTSTQGHSSQGSNTATAKSGKSTKTATAKSGKGIKTATAKGKQSTKSAKSPSQTNNANNKRESDSNWVTESHVIEARDDAPKGYHYETQFKIGDSSLVYGCAEKGQVDPGELVGTLIKQQCGNTGPCNPDNGEGTKIFWVAPSSDGDISWQWLASESMTVKTDGDYYTTEERDGFVGAIQAYANKLNTRKMQKFGTAPIGTGGDKLRVRADNTTLEPTLVQREDDSSAAKPHPTDIPWGAAETSTCELVTAAASYAFDRWKVSDTDKNDATLATRFRTDISIKNPSADWCSILTTTFGALAGIIPEFGAGISAVIGIASTACDSG